MIRAAQVIAAIGCPFLDLYRGGNAGYCYFVYDDPDNNVWETHTVYVQRLDQQTLEQWIKDGRAFVTEMEMEKKS